MKSDAKPIASTAAAEASAKAEAWKQGNNDGCLRLGSSSLASLQLRLDKSPAAAAEAERQHAPPVMDSRAAQRTLARVSSTKLLACNQDAESSPCPSADLTQEHWSSRNTCHATKEDSSSSSNSTGDGDGDSHGQCSDECASTLIGSKMPNSSSGTKCSKSVYITVPHPCFTVSATAAHSMAAAHCSSAKDMYDSKAVCIETDNDKDTGISRHSHGKGNTLQAEGQAVQFQASSSFNSTAGSSGHSSMMDPLCMVDNLAKPGGNTDVYAYLVYSTFRASSRWQLVQAVIGMLVTFLMQVGIIVLLWYGVIATMHKAAANQVVQMPLELDVTWRTVISSVEMPLAVVNMLVVLALSVYALEEARHAVSLSITAAACLELLPPFYGGEHFSSCSSACRGLRDMCYGSLGGVATPVLRVLVLAAPILQHIIALLVLVSAVDLTFLRSQTDIISIILDAAALVFLLELDTRVGTVLLNQHSRPMPNFHQSARLMPHRSSYKGSCGESGSFRHSNSSNSSSGKVLKAIGSYRKMLSMGQGKLSCRQLPIAVRMKLGHAYIALVGFLVLCEPLLLSSIAMLGVHMSWLVPMLPGGLLGFKHNRGPLTLWTLYGNQGICILMSCKTSLDHPILQDDMPVVLAVFYPLFVIAMVLLLCGNMLPSVSSKWNRCVLITQVVLGVVPHLLACGSRSMLLLLPVIVLLSWLSLFALWPLHWGLFDMCDKVCKRSSKAHDDAGNAELPTQQQEPQLQQHSAVVLHIPASSARYNAAAGEPPSGDSGCKHLVCKMCGGSAGAN